MDWQGLLSIVAIVLFLGRVGSATAGGARQSPLERLHIVFDLASATRCRAAFVRVRRLHGCFSISEAFELPLYVPPLLCPLSPTSLLIRGTPSLGVTFVLSPLWFNPLAASLLASTPKVPTFRVIASPYGPSSLRGFPCSG